MNKQHTLSYDYLEIDRMINEGLGGGLIYNEQKKKQLDLSETTFDIKSSPFPTKLDKDLKRKVG